MRARVAARTLCSRCSSSEAGLLHAVVATVDELYDRLDVQLRGLLSLHCQAIPGITDDVLLSTHLVAQRSNLKALRLWSLLQRAYGARRIQMFNTFVHSDQCSTLRSNCWYAR